MLNKISLRVRLVLLTLASTALVLCGAGIFGYQVAYATLESEHQRFVTQIVQSVAENIDRPFIRTAEGVRILNGFAQNIQGPPEQRRTQAEQIVRTIMESSPDRFNAYLAFEDDFFPGNHYPTVGFFHDASGKAIQVYPNLPGEPGFDSTQPIYDYFQQPWYTQTLSASGLVWSEPYFDPVASNAPLVSAVTAIHINGQAVGVAGSDLALDSMEEIIDQTKPTPNSYAMVVTRSGTLVAHSQKPNLVANSTLASLGGPMQQLATSIRTQSRGVIDFVDPDTNQNMIASYYRLKETNWSLVVVIPHSEIDASLYELQLKLLLVLIAALVVLAMLTWVMAHPILQPITVLLRETRRLASGGRGTVRLDIRRTDELGQMARDFERMAARIEDSYTRLEAQVAARTDDLQEALDERDAQTRELQAALAEVQQKEEVIDALSTPIVPVLQNTLVVPIIGSLDSGRARILLNKLLHTIETQRARIVILDVTGLPVVDTAVARTLLDAANSARLLGAEVLVVGIRPEVAQTLVMLGVNLSDLHILADLQAAVLHSITHLRRTHKPHLENAT